MRNKRLFIAIDLPIYIKDYLSTLQSKISRASWVEKANLHITLKFVGDYEVDSINKIIKQLQHIHYSAFFLSLKGTGIFPPQGHPGVIWAGIGTAHPLLFALQKAIEDRLFAIGIEPEKRIYRPHITLARCKESSEEKIKQWLKQNRNFEGPDFKVNTFALFSSYSTSNSPIYNVEEEFNLN